MMRSDFRWATAAFLLFASSLAAAQPFPTKPLRIIVPYSAGGPADTVGRLLAERMSQNIGQPVVVVAKDGAGTIIGTDYAAKSSPDGYTMLLTTTAIVTNALLYRKLPYSLERDLAPLAMYYVQPNILVVPPASPVKSLKELIAIAKANPGKLRYGSSGVGATVHLYSELLARSAGIELTHIPYKGVAPAVIDLMGGRLDVMFVGIAASAPQIKAGRMRPLGITSRQRSTLFPEIVPIAEQGLPDYDVKTWYGLFVPARTPRAIVDRLNSEVSKVTAESAFRQRLIDLGGEPASLGPDEFGAFIARELKLWGETIRAAKISLE